MKCRKMSIILQADVWPVILSNWNRLIYNWSIFRERNSFSICSCCRYPQISGLLDFMQYLVRSLAERGASLKIGYISDVPFVIIWIENVYMIVLYYYSSSSLRSCFSTTFRNWRIWYGLACPLTSCRFTSSGTRPWIMQFFGEGSLIHSLEFWLPGWCRKRSARHPPRSLIFAQARPECRI